MPRRDAASSTIRYAYDSSLTLRAAILRLALPLVLVALFAAYANLVGFNRAC